MTSATAMQTPPDLPSYDELYMGERARVLRLCRLVLGNEDLAQEVCQDTFLKLHVALGREERTMDWPRWLTRVAVNGAKDVRRSRWWHSWVVRGEDFDEAVHASGDAGPVESAERGERNAAIRRAFLRLPERQREVLALRHVEGWSTEEVAKLLGLSAGTVKRHLFRAVAAVRTALGEER